MNEQEWILKLIRKVHIMYQAWKWGRLARRAVRDRLPIAAEMAIRKYDELNNML